MKIAYMIPTRGNPRRAAACIEVARSLSSGKHEIEFLVGVDRDDKETVKFMWDFYPDVIVSVADRAPALGSIWNRLAAITDAEAFCAMGDDVFVTTKDWDDGVAKFCPPGSVSVVAWTDTGSPNQPTYPILSRGWYNLNGVYTDYFPFWFDDTWLAEVWSFATGASLYIAQNLVLASKHGKTKRMRELKFWWGFFSATRQERMAKGKWVREQLGLEPLPTWQVDLLRRKWELRDDESAPMLEALESDFGPSRPAELTPEYEIAKENAQARLRMRRAA